MWNKLFSGFILLAAVAISGMSLYAYSWLSSIGDPRSAIANFAFFAGVASVMVWISSAVLLLIGNIILWTKRTAWGLWTSLVFFGIFTVVDSFVLSPAFVDFKFANGLGEDAFKWSYLLGVSLIIAAGILVFFNQYVVVRLYRKMYGIEVIDHVDDQTADDREESDEQ